MKYSDFVKKVAERCFVSQVNTKRVLDAANLIIKDAVKSGDEVTLNGVGKFGKKTRPARVGINPATKEKVNIPETEVVTFKVAKEFKDHLNS